MNLSRHNIWEIIILVKIDEIGLALFALTLKYIIMSKKLSTDLSLKNKRVSISEFNLIIIIIVLVTIKTFSIIQL